MPFRLGLFLILAFIITAVCGLIYVTVHQNYRQSANDPQIQISESMANMLSQGQEIQPYLPEKQADISKSLATFVIIYDDSMNPVNSSAVLDGQTPPVPQGVLDFAKEHGQNRVTWEPKDGVRIAAVVTRYDGGYVLAGRSLREVEKRTDMLTKEILGAWLGALVIVFAGVWFLVPNLKKSH